MRSKDRWPFLRMRHVPWSRPSEDSTTVRVPCGAAYSRMCVRVLAKWHIFCSPSSARFLIVGDTRTDKGPDMEHGQPFDLSPSSADAVRAAPGASPPQRPGVLRALGLGLITGAADDD